MGDSSPLIPTSGSSLLNLSTCENDEYPIAESKNKTAVKIARELNLKRNTAYIPLALRNIYQTCPEPQRVRNRAQRKDFKTAVLSKAHQSVLTLMFIKSVDPNFDITKVEQECKAIFDHYLPDISMIANGELTIVDGEDEEQEEGE